MVFERKSQKLLRPGFFYLRLFKHLLIAFGLVVFSIGAGALGHRLLEEMSWIDAVYNASMILTGMGPVNKLNHDISKLFASAYAFYGGVKLLAITGIVLAPIAHRILHVFHLRENE